MADNKMEKSIKEAIGKSLNEFNKRIGMAKLIKDNKNQDRILKGILSQVNDENIEKTEKSNVITLDNSTDGIVELQEIKGDTNVNVSKIEKETPITHVIDDKNGNVISLDGITEGAISIDNIQGNTMVNCNKDTDKELILMSNLDTNGYSNVTITEGVDGGKVDVSLQGNTMVNVCDQEDPIAITKSYTVDTGNHIALQGEYDGKCRPNIYGNTLVNLVGNSNLWQVGSNGSINTDYTITSTDTQGIVTNKLTDTVSYFYLRKQIDPNLFKPSTTYTIIFNSLNVIQVGIVSANAVEVLIPLKTCKDGYKTLTITSTDFSTITGKNAMYLYLTVSKNFIGTVKASDVIVLEGDYTNKPIPDYFTGMKSSFEDKLVPENLASDVLHNGEINKQYTNLSRVSSSKLKRNTKYTTFIKNDSEESITVYSDNSGGNFRYNQITIPAKSSKVATIITKDEELSTTKNTWLSLDSNETLPQNISAYLVEGDYTNYDFTDYDSTKGGKYKVDYKVTGKNKFNGKSLLPTYITSNEGIIQNTVDNDARPWAYSQSQYFIPLSPGSYAISMHIINPSTDSNNACRVDSPDNSTIISWGNEVFTSVSSYSTNFTLNVHTVIGVQLKLFKGATCKIQIEEGTTATTYEPYKESIKTLYLNSPLLANDLILNSGNKIQHAHRFKQLILDGSETTWIDSERELDNTVLYAITLNDIKEASSTGEVSTLLCDKFTTIPSSSSAGTWGVDKEGISVNTTKAVHIRIAKSKLSEVSLNGFKRWLDANPVKIIYPLKSSNYEIISTNDNLLLDSYTKGHLDVDSVIPIDKVVFKSWGINLKYLYPSIEYTIQFESDNAGILYGLNLNNNNSITNLNIVKGINKFTISTSDTITASYLWTNGIGFNASKIVVTPKVDNNFGYFKGMKSVGECENNKIEILSQNKNLWNPIINNNTINYKCEVTYSNGIITIRGTGDGTGECYTNNYSLNNCFIIQQLKPNTSYYFSYESDGEFGIGNGTDTIEAFIFGSYGGIKYNIPPKGTTFKTDNKGFVIFRFDVNKNDMTHTFYNFMLTEGTEPIDYTSHKHNKKEILLNEPLRGLPNGVKDKYVIIDGKWYIERNCGVDNQLQIRNWLRYDLDEEYPDIVGFYMNKDDMKIINALQCDKFKCLNTDAFPGKLTRNDEFLCGVEKGTPYFKISIYRNKLETLDANGFKKWLSENNVTIVYPLKTPTYEPIDYNPFEVYTDITHISNNSLIPANMVIKNSGYNCILKPNTTYTVSSNNGLSTVTTKNSIGDSILRFYNKDTSKITKMSNVLVLEGDYVTGNPPIPAFFEGMESAFEQELVTDEKDKNYGKYKVEVLANNGNLLNGKNIMAYGDVTNNNGVFTTATFKKEYGWFRLKLINTYKLEPGTYYFQFKMRSDICKSIINEVRFEEIPDKKYLSYTEKTINPSCSTDYQVYELKYVVTKTLEIKYIFIQGDKTASSSLQFKEFALSRVRLDLYVPHQSNKIQFFLNEPLRGVGDIKDKVYVKEDKVVVERNCGSVVVDGNLSISVPNKDTTPNWYNLSAGGLKVNILIFSIPKPSDCANTWGSGTNNNRAISDKFIIYPSIDSSAFYDGEKIVFDSSDIKIGINKTKLTSQDIDGFRQWLQNNPTTIVYQLATPVYEEVEYPNNRLTLNTYNNSTLFYNSNIPISNTSFKPLWEELVYIKNSTTYYIQFNAVGNGNVVVNLGGTELTTAITEGYNKIEITTPNKSTNLLTIDGQGIKISKVVVSEALCSGYYKGLQSCFEEHMENGKYVCVVRGISLDGSKVNGIKFYLNEPLRGIGDIKDKLCIKDNKLMVERNCEEVILDGSDSDINLKIGGIDGNTGKTWFNYEITNKNIINEYASLVECNIYNSNPMNSHNRTENNTIGGVYQQNMACIRIVTEDFNKLQDFKDYLKQNQVKVVYKLQTPVYEEVTNEYGLPIILEGYENGIVYVDSAVTPTTSIKYTSNNTVPTTLSNVDNLNTATQNDINNNIVTYMMDIDMMLTEMEMDDNASTMSLSDLDDNNKNHDNSHNNILDRMNKEDRIKYQDNTTKMLEKVIKGKSLTKEENINRIDLYLSEGKIRKEQSNYLKELLKGVE